MTNNFIGQYIVFTGTFTILLVTSTYFANASHTKGTFPSVGHLWMSVKSGYSGLLYVSSTNCNSAETSAFSKIKTSTTGTTEMSDWKNGIKMSQYNCSGTWSYNTDIKLSYVSTHPTPGENFDIKNTSSYCTFWQQTYPCGVRSQIKISLAWWNNASSLSRQRLIMHETGHSLGLAHHCSADSIMNDGTLGCNSGRWTQITGYQSTDRNGINAVY